MKERGVAGERPRVYQDIEIPKNSPVGVIIGGLAFVLGFAMVWWMWWLAILCGLGIWAALIWRSSDDETDFVLAAEEVERLEVARYRAMETARMAGRA
jgi:cytochrome o ubiquinol oxidase subunit I